MGKLRSQPGRRLSPSSLILSKDAHVSPEALCPFKSDRMAQFVNSISFHLAHTSPHPSTPYPTLRSWWLFLSLPTMPGPCTSPSRHTQPVQGLWDPWHPPLLEYKSLINNKRPPLQKLRSWWANNEGEPSLHQGQEQHRQVRTGLHSP